MLFISEVRYELSLPSFQVNIIEDALKDARGEEDLLNAYGGTSLPAAPAAIPPGSWRPVSALARSHSPGGRPLPVAAEGGASSNSRPGTVGAEGRVARS